MQEGRSTYTHRCPRNQGVLLAMAEKGEGFFMNQEQQPNETKYELCANKTIEATLTNRKVQSKSCEAKAGQNDNTFNI